MSKPVYTSKTAVFNLFAAMSAIIAMSKDADLANNPTSAMGGVILIAVINMVLRFFTTTPISFFHNKP